MSAVLPSNTVAPAPVPARSPLRQALSQLRREFVWVAVFGCFTNLLMLTPTLYMLQVFDRVMLSSNVDTLLALTALAVVMFAAMGFSDWLRSRLLVRVGLRLDAMMQHEVFRVSYSSGLTSNVRVAGQPLTDLAQIRQFLTGNGVFAAVDLPWTFIYLGVLFLMHPWLGWASVLFAVVMLAVAVLGHRLTAKRHEQVQEATMESTAYLQGKLRNAETVQALGMLDNLRNQWLTVHDRLGRVTTDAHEMSHRMQSAVKFVQYTQQSLILALGALLAIDGRISAGAMIACNALMGNALRPIGMIVSTWKQFIDARAGYRRLSALLVANPAPQEQGRVGPIRGQVTLQGLVATAPNRKTPILAGLDATFAAGEVIAIVGPSGAGKSTLARCLIGIWPHISAGQVLLDGQPMKSWDRDALGPQLGYLPQDVELFDGTIAENIGRFADVPSEMVIEAATRTGIHDMVLRMPKGYDTPMGEAGGLLSGGQRQRIALARAVLGSPRLVVLDEPNANLDDVGEEALQRAVRQLAQAGSTVFMIVHQKHMLAVANRVLILDEGRIKGIHAVQIQPAPTQIEKPAT